MGTEIRVQEHISIVNVEGFFVKKGRIGLTESGPELDVCASELGPNQHLNERCG